MPRVGSDWLGTALLRSVGVAARQPVARLGGRPLHEQNPAVELVE
ncbi:hypothetical protein [Saccharothrix sp. NRRL B-16348]|nr:hypothetical protein [Saccharothrix sp. NRRL B-16348]